VHAPGINGHGISHDGEFPASKHANFESSIPLRKRKRDVRKSFQDDELAGEAESEALGSPKLTSADGLGLEGSVNGASVDAELDRVSSGTATDQLGPTEGLAFARGKDLEYQQVQAADGKIAVANALCVNNSYTGVLKVPPHTDTGPQRALKGDEIFYVHGGHVRLEMYNHRYILHEGDHIAIPHNSCYSFYNSGAVDCRLVFFVPRNPFVQVQDAMA
jgi:mannose-6-phosphate isomerase-like protein (cupin superfamily)